MDAGEKNGLTVWMFGITVTLACAAFVVAEAATAPSVCAGSVCFPAVDDWVEPVAWGGALAGVATSLTGIVLWSGAGKGRDAGGPSRTSARKDLD